MRIQEITENYFDKLSADATNLIMTASANGENEIEIEQVADFYFSFSFTFGLLVIYFLVWISYVITSNHERFQRICKRYTHLSTATI